MQPELWESVKRVFDEITESDPNQRIQILDGLDPELRQQVERLLKSYDQTERHGSSGFNTLPDHDFVVTILRDQHTFAVGQLLLDRFEIRRLLGSGGMGEVYEAHDRNLGPIAIKTLRIELASDQTTIEAFRREIVRGRKVAHPNVCKIYDLFEAEDHGEGSTPFFTMELLPSETLLAAVDSRGPFPEAEARAIALDLCAGLQAAHDAGIIHGDFKGGNVILTPDASGKTIAKITDFGFARVAPWAQPVDAVDGFVGGTRQYMSGEVLSGAAPSASSDIFSLGVVLFHLRTAQYPFDPKADWAKAKADRSTPPSLEELAERLESNWVRAISACLAPAEEKRPKSAAEVAQMLAIPEPSPLPLLRRKFLWAGIGMLAAAAAGEEYWRRGRVYPITAGPIKTLVEDFGVRGESPSIGRAARNLVHVSLASYPRFDLIKPAAVETALEKVGLGGQTLKAPISRHIATMTKTRIMISGDIAVENVLCRISCRAVDMTNGKEVLTQDMRAKLTDLPAAFNQLAEHLAARLDVKPQLAQVAQMVEQTDTTRADALESFTLGLLFYQAADQAAALENLREATRRDSDFAIAYTFQVLALMAFHQEDQALEPALKAYQLRDKLNHRQRLYAEHYYLFLNGDYGEAIKTLRLLVESLPQDANLCRQLSTGYELLERPDLSLPLARRAADLDPASQLNKNVLVLSLVENGLTGEGHKTLNDALQRNPNSPVLLYAKGCVHLVNLECDQAIAVFETIIRQNHTASMSRSQVVKANMLAGRWDRAKQDLLQDLPVLEFQREVQVRNQYRYWLGQTAALTGDQSTLFEQARVLSELDPIPTNLHSFHGAAQLAWMNGRLELLNALEDKLRATLRKHASTRAEGYLHFTAALAAHLQHDQPGAEVEIQQADRFWPDLTTNWIWGELLLARGATGEALTRFEKVVGAQNTAIRFDTGNIWVWSLARAAGCLEKLGRLPEAEIHRRRFRERWGSHNQYTFTPPLNSVAWQSPSHLTTKDS